jgi:hypothetical protein
MSSAPRLTLGSLPNKSMIVVELVRQAPSQLQQNTLHVPVELQVFMLVNSKWPTLKC